MVRFRSTFYINFIFSGIGKRTLDKISLKDKPNSKELSERYNYFDMSKEDDLSTNFSVIELDILDKKIRRLVCKLQKV